MAEPRWLTEEMVQAIHDDQIATHGGAYGLRDAGLLASAMARARNRYVYEGADMHQLAAAYGYGIVKNHAFVDGNKRTAFLAMYVFLKIHGFELKAPEPEVVLLMQALASDEVSEVELVDWLKQYS
ncbi:MAG: type II toxin-antitoxin system death-on-curing family toxin [Nostoc sp.]|uniref:type II toxin-antitoxin system death-on-curing family toxin n=1 Tax=Nostoc sp. TaxID=1180 RepID=UPI002FF43472